MSARTIEIPANDGSGRFRAYLSLPEGESGPAIVAIQEIFGVNTGMRRICDDLARRGYIALCPDLFWRQEPGVELSDAYEADWQRAFALYKGFDVDKGVEDIAACVAWLRSFPGLKGGVGAVGYCLGGLLAFLTACRTDVEAAVGYYGVGIDGKLDEAAKIKGRLMLHIAEEDGFVDKAAQARIHEGLRGNPRVVLHDYAGADHAFARPDGQHWKADAAELANRRTADFFAKYLA